MICSNAKGGTVFSFSCLCVRVLRITMFEVFLYSRNNAESRKVGKLVASVVCPWFKSRLGHVVFTHPVSYIMVTCIFFRRRLAKSSNADIQKCTVLFDIARRTKNLVLAINSLYFHSCFFTHYFKKPAPRRPVELLTVDTRQCQ
jgi:hypothetical protein